MKRHDYERYPELTNSQLETEQWRSPHPQIVEDFRAVVEEVTDGDTVQLSCSFRNFVFPLRLLDIDALELSEGGKSAKEWLREKVEGKDVLVLIDRRQRVGKYGRLLGKLFFMGRDVGEEMIIRGFAVRFGKKNEFAFDALGKQYSRRNWYGTV